MSDVRLIDANALIAELNDTYEGYMLSPSVEPYEFKGMVDNAPTIDPKRGEWVKNGVMVRHPDALNYHCSICGVASKHYNYCPHCGAQMKE